MQHQQEFDQTSNTPEETPAPLGERQRTTDPREQPPAHASTSRSSEAGYTDVSERDFWPYEGEKLQPEPKNQKSIGGLLAVVVLLCAVFIAGSFFGVILSWLTWVVVLVLIIAGLAALVTNWRVVTLPMPTRTFQIREHARLVLTNGAGTVALRRGEEGMVSVTATKRTSGEIRVRTGSGRVEAYDLGGRIALKTGSGRIEISQATLSGESFVKTGSNAITFDGSLDALGSYQFQTGSGGITLSLPDDAAFSLNARTSSGGVYNAFGSNEVGNGPHAPLKLRTGSGGIRIYRVPQPHSGS